MCILLSMTQEEFITSALTALNVPLTTSYGKNVIDAVLLGYREAGWSAGGYSNFVKKYFAQKPRGVKIASYLGELAEMKHCNRCKQVKDIKYFSKNSSKRSNLATYCKTCMKDIQDDYYPEYYKNNRYKYVAAKIRYTLALQSATPKGVDLEKIKEIYNNCPEGYHVDHYYPLQGEDCCGLHVPWNLQYLTAHDNISKSNKMPVKPYVDPLSNRK